MKKSLSIMSIAALIAAAIFSSCDTPQENVKDAKQDLLDAERNLVETRVDSIKKAEWQEFKAVSQGRIAGNKAEILVLKDKKTGKITIENAAYQRQIETLEDKNAELQRRMDEYEKYQSDWDGFKREFNHDMDELGKSLKDLGTDNKD